MSAAAKLRALDEARHFDTPTTRSVYRAGTRAERRLLDALPELIAVVEAADEVLQASVQASPETWALELALEDLATKLGGNL